MKVVYHDGTVAECPKEDALHILRHTAAHIMAQAVKRLYPYAVFAYGPANDKGFYYDVDLGDTKLSEDDLITIETEMRRIVKENLPIKPYILPRGEAVALMEQRGEAYKVEHIRDLPDDAVISFYQQGEYVDLCVGPHLCYTKALKTFKLLDVSGAYWKNDSSNKMLTRIRGTAFLSQNELDHMYSTTIDEDTYCVKPMNCPGGVLVYRSKPRSYRELPLRIGELGLVHRHEMRGALHGLLRVRCFTQDDAHIFMRREQITGEIINVVHLIDEVYSRFGFKYAVELSTRPADSMGSDEDWDAATNGLKQALELLKLPYTINEGDGAFYGPKIDLHLEDSLGRTWQCGTIQLDFQMPLNFGLEYIDENGEKQRPIMIHRVCFGSIERFIGILTEHFAGKFPVWLAPTQVKVLLVSEKSADYGQEIYTALRNAKIRCELDARNEKIGYLIREAQVIDRVPYMVIIGQKEAEERKISVRSRDTAKTQTMTLADFMEIIHQDIDCALSSP